MATARGRRHAPRLSPLRAGAIVVVLLCLLVYAAFTKHVPLRHGFRLNAVFSSAVNIDPGAPVRIAGVPAGSVTGISREPGSSDAIVHIDVDGSALPLHADATLKIRPRLFLEGSFFVDLTPGSPSAPPLRSGATLPVTQTADPVQIDQVLDALDASTRTDLQQLLAAYGTALTHVPSAAENATQDRLVRGRTAAQALNDAARRAPAALRDTAIVAQALGGEHADDVSVLVASLGRATGALAQDDDDLEGLVVNLDLTLQTFAAQSAALGSTITRLPGALTSADDSLASLDQALPTTRAFADDLVPAVDELPATITAALPWIGQARALLAPGELGGLSGQLAAAAPSLAALAPSLSGLSTQLDSVSRCVSRVLVPAADTVLQDGAATTGLPNYQELFHALVGLNSVGSGFDGNGQYVRAYLGSGGASFSTGPISAFGERGTGGSLDVLTSLPPEGTSPANPGREPPFQTSAACAAQALPDFNGPAAHGPADGPGR